MKGRACRDNAWLARKMQSCVTCLKQCQLIGRGLLPGTWLHLEPFTNFALISDLELSEIHPDSKTLSKLI